MPLLPKQEIIDNPSTTDPIHNMKVELHTEEEIPIDVSYNVKQEAEAENVQTSIDEFLQDELDFEPEEKEESIDPQIGPYLEELLWQGFIDTLEKKKRDTFYQTTTTTIENGFDKNTILSDTERLDRKKLFTDKTIFVYQLPLQVIKKLPKAWRDDGRLISARQLIRRLNTVKHKRPSAVKRTQKWLEERRAKRGLRATSVSTTLSDSSGSRDYNRTERKRPSSPKRQRSPPTRTHDRRRENSSGSPPIRKRPHEDAQREADRIKRTRRRSPSKESRDSEQRFISRNRSRDQYRRREYEQTSRDEEQRSHQEFKRRSSDSVTKSIMYEPRSRPSRVHGRLSSGGSESLHVHDRSSSVSQEPSRVHDRLSSVHDRRRRRSRSNSYERFCNSEKRIARAVPRNNNLSRSYDMSLTRSHDVSHNVPRSSSRNRLMSSSPDDLRSRIKEKSSARRARVIVVPAEQPKVASSDYW